MTVTHHEDIEAAARRLADFNREAEPGLQAIYLFPAEDEIRLIEVDPTTLPSDSIEPYYFGADPANRLFFPSAIALIRPEEVGVLALPEGWGTWSEARLLFG
jgi:hypothetical protein